MSNLEVIKVEPENLELEKIVKVIDILQSGGIVAMPTETVYGLAVNVEDKGAVERLRKIKNRDESKPFPMQVFPLRRIYNYVDKSVLKPNVYRLIEAFWPGPLTIIFPSDCEYAASGKLGIRVSSCRMVQEVLSRGGISVFMPSANPSDAPPATNASEVLNYFSDSIDLIVDAGNTGKVSSTVVDVTASPWRLLREGVIREDKIRHIENKKRVVFVCSGNSCRSVMAEYYMRKLLLQKEKQDEVEVFSCGVMVVDGIGGATKIVVEMLKKEGIDASKHIRRAISENLLLSADLILVMERYHEGIILRYLPFLKNRIYLLGEFLNDLSSELEIPDPIGGSWEVYEDVFGKIKTAVNRVVDML